MRSKKLSLTISLFVAVLGLCIGLAGCDSFLHTHAFSPWATVSPPSCTAAGIQERTCACGASESAPVPATGHTVATDPAVDPSCTGEGKPREATAPYAVPSSSGKTVLPRWNTPTNCGM